uniref:Scarlet n=1 Tax=Limnogonus franciscanus TaxID=913166 RepID=A0A5C1YVC3_9HEMI|nr:scarlet [Limnogonus franciscanus]
MALVPATEINQMNFSTKGFVKEEIWEQPEDGSTLTWTDLSIYVRCKKPRMLRPAKFSYKRIVNNVSGAVQAGHMVALMGPSGAGKSSMLCALGHRYHGGLLVTGDVRVNGRRSNSMHLISGYMHQEDLFIGALTVQEHLYFMANLRMDRRTSKTAMKARLAELVNVLGLSDCLNSRIGGIGIDSEHVVLSGGERKRLSFATECLTDPPLLFCDEPTTGLDSFNAIALATVMRHMADSRSKTILATVHQPSPDVLASFHSIILLAEGSIVFCGTPQDALDFFQEQGYKMSRQCSVAEFLVSTVAPTPGAERETERAVRDLSHHFALSEHNKEIDMILNYQYQMAKETTEMQEINYKEPFWIVKLYWLCYRASLEVLRNPNVQWIRIFQKVLIAVMAGMCYTGAMELTQAGVQAVQGALFILVTENTFAPMYAFLALFPMQFPLFIREYNNGTYSALQFYLTKIISNLPGLVLEAAVFTTIFYYLAGLRETFYAFGMVMLVTILCINVSSACGAMFSTAFDSPSFAMAYLVPFDYAVMITSGLFIKLSSLPSYAYWIQYLSWLMYSYESMTILQWDDVENITCTVDQPYLPCASSGIQVLDNYSFSIDHLFPDMYAMIGLYFGFHIIAFLFFIRKIKTH